MIKKKLKKYYPKNKILHPQVEFVGHLLLNHAFYTVKDHLIGFRSRNSQFIFRALKNKNIRKKGKHQNIELFAIFKKLNEKYKLNTDHNFLAKRLIFNSLVLYPKEKILLGRKFLYKNYKDFCDISPVAKKIFFT